MDPVSAILAAASTAGAILGGQRKSLDINWLKQHFGAAAVTKEALQLFNTIINSPHGQSLIASAAEEGQSFARNTAQNAAMAGLQGGGAGADSGAGIFSTSAAQGAGDAFQRDVRSNIWQTALPAAQQMVQDRMQAYLQDRQMGGVQTPGAAMWQQLGTAAGTIGSMYQPSQKQPGSELPGYQASLNRGPDIATPNTKPMGNMMAAGSGTFSNQYLPQRQALLPKQKRLQNYGPSMSSLVQRQPGVFN